MDARIVSQLTVGRRGWLIRCGMAVAGAVALVLAAAPPDASGAAPVWRDDFDGDTLDGAWYWHNENPDGWSLPGDGFLYIASSPFPTGGENLLLRSGAEGNFTIETHVLFEPIVNYQIAGLVIYQDEANFLQLGRAYCEDDGCVGNGIYFDNIQDGGWVDGNFATTTEEMDEAYLRLEVNGRKVTAYYSGDGESWRKIGQHTLASDFQPLAVGLTSSQNYDGVPLTASFDYFSMTGSPKAASPFVGHWQAMDVDGSDIRLSIGGPPSGPFKIAWTESHISFCGGEAGIIKGTGVINLDDPYLLEADLTVECFTTGASTALHLSIRYHSNTGALSTTYPGGLRVVFTHPGKPHEPPAPLRLRASYQEDWVEGFYPEGYTVWIAVTEGDGRTVKATAEVATGPVPFWDGEIGFSTLLVEWDPEQPDLAPNDWVYGWANNGASAQMRVGEIIPTVDLEANLVQGTIAADWFDEEVFVFCTVWGYSGDWLPDMVVPDGSDNFSCDFSGLWDIVQGDTAEVWYYGPDGHAVGHYIPPVGLRVNYGHDWVESFYEAGHWVDLTVTESDGITVKATAQVYTEPKDFWGGNTGFQTTPEDWSPSQPDLQSLDWVYAAVDNGVTAQVQIGDIAGDVTIFGQLSGVSDNVTGTILADWITSPVAIECLDWGSGLENPINKDAGMILTDGTDSYVCEWDRETEWDLQAWQEIGVGYSTPDGHWVANAFHAEHWMGTWIHDLSDGLSENGYSYHFDWAYTIPEPGDSSENHPADPLTLVVSEAAAEYDGYVLVGPWSAMSPRAWTGSACEVVSEIRAGQPIRFIWGWVNDYSMTYEEALAHFSSFSVDVSWDGGSPGSGMLQRVDELPEFYNREARFDYMCGFTEPPEEP